MKSLEQLLENTEKELQLGEQSYKESDAFKIANEMYNQLEKVQNFYNHLREEQSKVDLAISDVEHFVEISSNLNAAEGYNTYKMLRSLLRRRREIKDTISELRPLINSARPNDILKYKDNTLREVQEQAKINSSEDRHYNTRILTKIFGDKIQEI